MDDFTARFRPEFAELVREHANRARGFVTLVGLSVEEYGPGTVLCRLPYRPEIDNSMGSVHGGAIAALIDHTLSLAVYPLVEPGVWVATSNMQYLHPVRAGDCFAEGTVVSLGTRQAVVRVEVTNDGRTVATALGGVMVRAKESQP
jgi:uncharacterized protein (TIGR00369 family)